MFSTVWRQSPVTVLRFLSESVIIIGCANEIQILDWSKNLLLCSRKFYEYVAVHHINITEEPDAHCFLIAAAGNRFYAALRLHCSTPLDWALDTLFENYTSDNIVNCCVGRPKLFDCFCFISAHGQTIVKPILKNKEKDELTVIKETSVCSVSAAECYSGVIRCSTYCDRLATIGFFGATFGQVFIRIDNFRLPANGHLIHESYSGLQTLHCQKGVIFSLDLCVLEHPSRCSLVSAAEDRSIAVWTTALETADDVTSYRGPWNLLYCLSGGSPNDGVVFESRIRMVVPSEKGILAVGEDCRIVWYPWDAINKVKVINNTHRGHGIWCADLWLPRGSVMGDAILVSGGNDGAICVQSLISAGQPELEVTNLIGLPEVTESATPIKADLHPSQSAVFPCSGSGEDFPRSLFFGPEGRLFYLTNMGRIHTAALSINRSKPRHNFIRPYFRHSVADAVFHNPCDDRTMNSMHLISAVTDPRLSDLFSGYSVCATNVDHTLLAIGDRVGRVYLFQFLSESPYLVCTDLVCLDQKLMELIWLDANLLMAATRSGPAVLLRVKFETVPALFTPQRVTLTLPAGPGMRWINTGCLCPVPRDNEKEVTHYKPLLIVGTRDGGLYMFQVDWQATANSFVSPIWSLEACHGRGGCTAVLCFPTHGSNTSLLISCGRTHGELRCWTVDLVHRTLMLRSLIPNSPFLTWVERFCATEDGRVFALGFQSIYFKAYQISLDGITLDTECLSQPWCWFRATCGGGNRSWGWWTSPRPDRTTESPCFVALTETDHLAGAYTISRSSASCSQITVAILASINKGGVLVQWAWRSLQTGLRSRYIRPILHGRDVNCCLVVTRPVVSSSTLSTRNRDRSHVLLCFSGGEDTTLSSWALMGSVGEKHRNGWTFVCSPEHHRGHLSNIRCLVLPQKLSANNGKWHPEPKYLLTGGGRGQIGLWSLHIEDTMPETWLTRGTWRPGWLGFTRLRHSEPDDQTSETGPTGRVTNTTRHSVPGSADLRVMALVCLAHDNVVPGLTSLLGLAACSDGSIRMIYIEPPQPSNPRNPRMHEIGSLECLCGRSDLSRACYLDLQLIDFSEQAILVVSSTSRGELRGWCVRWPLSDDADRPQCELRWLLPTQPIPPYNLATKPAINCLALLTPCNSSSNTRLHLAVGADDGSVRIASVPSLDCQFGFAASEPRWVTSAVHHFATVVRLCSESECLFFTLSADQRVICWSFDPCTAALIPLRRAMLAGLGDPHGMDISFVSDNLSNNSSSSPTRTFILTTGTGTTLLEWSTV